MLFNSLVFAVFLALVFLIYWFILNNNHTRQNGFLLSASYFFYGWWDWRLLFLLISVSLLNYVLGIKIGGSKAENSRKSWLISGIVINISILGVFKYSNFFIEEFVDLISLFGYELTGSAINIILPLGISFYTFLSLSYILDIYKKNLAADKNVINVLLSLGFFPIILAGPIQRPSKLLPQIRSKRTFNYDQAVDGLRQILWGLFVKIAVADNLAPFADDIFANYLDYSGSTLLAGALFYTIQIYADFAGYSHIAIGTASLLGFRLMKNFNYPYFSRDISEFWKKWHISLTTWFRDYLFLPVSFAVSWKIKTERVLAVKTELFIYIIASIITWFLTGLWHGANYTFIMWGMINGFFLVVYQWQRKPRKELFQRMGINNDNRIVAVTEGLLTFLVIMLSWVVFRSDTVHRSFEYLNGLFSKSLFTPPQDLPIKEILIAILFIIFEYIQRDKRHALQIDKINNGLIRLGIYIGVVFIILLFGGGTQTFIYFQF